MKMDHPQPPYPLPPLRREDVRLGFLRMTSYRRLELAANFYMEHGVYEWENIIGSSWALLNKFGELA